MGISPNIPAIPNTQPLELYAYIAPITIIVKEASNTNFLLPMLEESLLR